jgi:hypothetical protein
VGMAQTAPKDAETRRNRTPLVHDWVDVPDVPCDGPALTRLRPDRTWFPVTLAWWEAIRTMPHAKLWSVTDWTFAAETAMLVEQINCGEGGLTASIMGQLTRRELEMGMTEPSRRQQRIRYVQRVEETPAAPVARDAGRRTRLRSAS